MLIRDVISRVKSLYNRGAASDDSRLSNRHVYSKIRSVRSLLIKRQQDKRTALSPWNIQVIECLQLEIVDPATCDCVEIPGCKLLRSKCEIPRAIQTKIGTGIENVSSLDGTTIFSPTTWAKKKYKSGNKYTSKQSDYFIRDNYLYITHNTVLQRVSISGVFENPYEVDRFNNDGNCACEGDLVDACANPMDSTLALDEYLIEPLMELCVKELIQIFAQMPEDNENNAKSTEVAKDAE